MPTSLIPLGEVLNDHRPFFGTIGLCWALVWAWALLVERATRLPRWFEVAVPLLVLSGHSYAAHLRNEIWSTDERIWGEAARKAPRQGRNHMNYAVSLMKQARWAEAETELHVAEGLLPEYSHVFINLGFVLGAQNKRDAERSFQKALQLSPDLPEAYSHYAEWLAQRGRLDVATALVNRGLALSPRHARLLAAQNQLQERAKQAQQNALRRSDIERAPTAAAYIDLSLAHYNNTEYAAAIASAEAALLLDPNNAFAFNNICAAHNRREEWELATDACSKALRIDPTMALAQNNLAIAREHKIRP